MAMGPPAPRPTDGAPLLWHSHPPRRPSPGTWLLPNPFSPSFSPTLGIPVSLCPLSVQRSHSGFLFSSVTLATLIHIFNDFRKKNKEVRRLNSDHPLLKLFFKVGVSFPTSAQEVCDALTSGVPSTRVRLRLSVHCHGCRSGSVLILSLFSNDLVQGGEFEVEVIFPQRCASVRSLTFGSR